MNQDFKTFLKLYRGCVLAAKPSIYYQHWPKTYKPWSRLHVDYPRPLIGAYYLIVVDTFSKLT